MNALITGITSSLPIHIPQMKVILETVPYRDQKEPHDQAGYPLSTPNSTSIRSWMILHERISWMISVGVT